jgi:hypothetical protein
MVARKDLSWLTLFWELLENQTFSPTISTGILDLGATNGILLAEPPAVIHAEPLSCGIVSAIHVSMAPNISVPWLQIHFIFYYS